MPRFDLAGNPLPDTPLVEAAPRSAPPPTDPSTRPDAVDRMFHAAPPPVPAAAPAYAAAGPVQYDLAGNPVPSSASAAASPHGTPAPGAAPGVWPPPPAGGNPYSAYGAAPNDSGAKAGVPPEIAALKWNWGAFALTWLWCLNHRLIAWGVGILLGGFVLRLIPTVGPLLGGGLSLVVSIYFGITGHRMAWQNRHFPGGLPQFFDVQRAWMKWGIGIMIVSVVLGMVLGALLVPVFMRARQNAIMNNGSYSQPYGNGRVFIQPVPQPGSGQ